MPSIILPHRWLVQPQYPVEIDWGNPLTAKLAAAIVHVQGAWRELTSNQIFYVRTGTYVGSKFFLPYRGVGAPSGVLANIGTNCGLSLTNKTRADDITGPFSVFVEHSVNNGIRTPLFESVPISINSTGFEVLADDNIVINTLAIGINVSVSNTFTLGSNALGTNSENYTHRSGITVDGTNYRGYVNGSLYVTTAGTLLPSSHASRRLHLNEDAGGRDGLAPFSIGLVWDRVLIEQEFAELSRNPWQIFRPIRRRIYVGPSAGGAYTLTAATGNFTLTGNATGLTAARNIAASSGTFTLTGNDTALKAGRVITAAQGSFALTGNDAALKAGRVIAAAQGSFALTGNDATLTYTPSGSTYTLTAATGSFTLTGNATGLTAARLLAANSGSITLTGNAAGLYRGYPLTADSGSFSLVGNAAVLKADRSITAATGAFTLTGNAATLDYGAAVDVSLIYKLLANRQELNASTGKFIIYDDDDVTPLLQADAWEDAAGTIPYSGNALRRIDRLS